MKWEKRAETIIDRLIPYMVVLLLIIIVLQFTAKEWVTTHHLWIEIFDYAIIAIFSLDLIFKYRRVHQFKPFIKKYWLDVIAIFPFYLVFRVFQEGFILFRIGEGFRDAQPLIHSGLEIEKAAVGAIREAELVKLTRTQKITRMLKPFSRMPRLAKAVVYFEDPEVHEKHIHKQVTKKIKQVKIR